MRYYARIAAAVLLMPAAGAGVLAQQSDSANGKTTPAAQTASAAKSEKPAASALSLRPLDLQHFRPADQRGINVFEPPKEDTVQFSGFKLSIGAAFAQDFQGLHHNNSASPNVVNGVDANKLMSIGHGFNNAVANLNLNAQVANGIRVAMTSYLSARHHQETWVKDGYVLIDASPIDEPILNGLMDVITLKIGHFEINYGDSHFRRSDNGNGMQNPFIGNYIMDAFTTEIGGEAYVRKFGLMAMASVTGGEVRGQVTNPGARSPSYIAKLGFDRQFTNDLRIRLTGSTYRTRSSASNTLYTGDRGGSRYYDVIENTTSTETAAAWSGNMRNGLNLSNKVTAVVINPFIKFRGLELFGNAEQAKGRAATETALRKWEQYAADAVYRFVDNKLFVGARYNTVTGRPLNFTNDVTLRRTAAGAGWFVTPVMLLKGEWVNQKYLDFPTTDIRSGGRFKGFLIEAAVAF